MTVQNSPTLICFDDAGDNRFRRLSFSNATVERSLGSSKNFTPLLHRKRFSVDRYNKSTAYARSPDQRCSLLRYAFYSFGRRQSFLNSVVYGGSADFKPDGPIKQTESFAFVRYKEGVSPISGLFPNSRPATIFRRVVFIVIIPFDAIVIRWFFAHIGKESCKTISPPFADLDPPASIIVVAGAFRIGAALDNSKPNSMFRCSRHAVLPKSRPARFILQTTATAGVAPTKTGSCNNADFPTFTAALPPSVVKSVSTGCSRRAPQNCQPIEFSTCDIDEFGHMSTPLFDRQGSSSTYSTTMQ